MPSELEASEGLSRATNEVDSPLLAFQDSHEFSRHRAILESLAPRLGRKIELLAFVLLKPDLVAAGQVGPMIARLRAAGHRVLDAFVPVHASVSQFEQLYKYNIALGLLGRRPESNWWLNSKLYQMGRVVCLLTLLPDGADPWGDLSRTKGPSNPFAAVAGQWRADFGAANRALNLVHCSDGPVCSVREFLLFHSVERLRSALARMDDVQLDPTRELGGHCLQHRLVDGDPVRLLIRVQRALLEPALNPNRSLELQEAARRRCVALELLSGETGTLQARMARFFALPPSHAGSKPRPANASLAMARELEDPTYWSSDLAMRIECCVNRSERTLSPWDCLLLKTTIFYGGDVRQFLKLADGAAHRCPASVTDASLNVVERLRG